MKEILVKKELLREWNIKTASIKNNKKVTTDHIVIKQFVEKYIKPWWVLEN